MQLNFIIRTNYFKVSRTVRHNVMAKETVLVAGEGGGGGGEGLQYRPKRSKKGERPTTGRRENVISPYIKALCLCYHSLR